MTEKFKMVKNIKVFMDPALRQELLEMYKESLKKTTVGAKNRLKIKLKDLTK